MRARLLACAGLACVVAASTALAQDVSDVEVRSCYEAGTTVEAREACIAVASNTCQTQHTDGGSTLGITLCNQGETLVWDRILNEEYQATMAWAKEADALEAETFPEFANMESSLRDAQRAWIGFRDAECGFAYAFWGAGSMRNIAATQCLMTQTAERAIRLWAIRETQP